VIDDTKFKHLRKDAGWRGALTILLGSPQLSNDGRVLQYVDLDRQEIQLAQILKDRTFSSGERTLLEIAASLFNQTRTVNLSQAFATPKSRLRRYVIFTRMQILDDRLMSRRNIVVDVN
jgi:hypothetical protein